MIITSLLDTDLYKFTMMQVVLHQFPGAEVEYQFKCRNAGAPGMGDLAPYVNEIREEIRGLCRLHFQDAELAYLKSMRFIKSDFVDFLSVFRFQKRFVDIQTEGDHLRIVARGPLVHVMAFEIFILYIVNELYFRRLSVDETILSTARERLTEKI